MSALEWLLQPEVRGTFALCVLVAVAGGELVRQWWADALGDARGDWRRR